MSKSLLIRYIRLALAEVKIARVPNQLISPKEEKGNRDDENYGEEVEEDAINVNEFSSCAGGNIMGYSGPLGIDPDKLGRKKNKRRKSA